LRLGHDREGLPRRLLPRRLAHTLGIPGDCRIALRIAAPLVLPEEPQGVTAPSIPALEAASSWVKVICTTGDLLFITDDVSADFLH